ncbi:bifunctional UDP-sugar hydrolase/5'-nucleotidase [Phycisphaerales bacterium AB-hyl4]|uniref:Bifunctional UDP-sugar hydrolase/5'-nucleotidase n=1 Tax=Natronomicrosphaera hydrolytica TaxID=3242702 RepID=A0ABV4U3U1_9BACT
MLLGTGPVVADQDHDDSEQVVLTILHVCDLHGRIYFPDEPQGLAKLGTLVHEVREQMPYTLLTDGGDVINGSPEQYMFGGLPIADAMNALEFDITVLGNHEFDFGQETLKRFIDQLEFPMLGTNFVDEETGEAWYDMEDVVWFERGGVKIAAFGLNTHFTAVYQYPRTLEGIEILEHVETARKMVEKLRDEADVVLLVSHMGHRFDQEIAEAVSGIDAILGGHTHRTIQEPWYVNDTLILHPGPHAFHLGRVDMLVKPGEGVVSINGRDEQWWGHGGVDKPTGWEDYSFPDHQLIAVTEDTADDPAVVAAYETYVERARPTLDEALTTATSPITGEGAPDRETPLGNLLADAVRAWADADVGLFHSTQFRAAGLEAGPVLTRDLYRIMGAYTRQHMIVVRTPGRNLRTMVEQAFDGESFPLHLSGMEVHDDDIRVGGTALDDGQMYTVVAAAHVIQDYVLDKEGVEIVDDDPENPVVRDAAIEFLRGHAPLTGELQPRVQMEAYLSSAD